MRRLLLVLALLIPLILLAVLRRPRADAGVQVAQMWPVMGTFLQARAHAPDSVVARAALRAARQAVFRVDSLMSTYRPESEISHLNARAGTGEWQQLSRESMAVLIASRRAADASGGAFDISVGPLMEAWGFRTPRAGRPDAGALDRARARVGYRGVELDSAGGRARLARPGMAVDLGAIAKGYALDLAGEAMRRAGGTAGMIDLGGNVLVFGAPGPERTAWRIGILDPADRDGTIGTIAVREGSVATSGNYEQFFEWDGVRYSHIMDARTGRPARGTAQVTVVAPGGLQADILSTVLFILGPEAGRPLLEEPLGAGAAALWVADSAAAGTAGRIVAGADPGRFRIR
ncbi:MAG TPA: FAD:protein FMN transferase [Longimicrobiales bacterium]|nr:FAD:protein FMN transferase [Longimicrobiales bacterium]